MKTALNPSNFAKYQPFVKWVGGKRGLLSQIIPFVPKELGNYFEPFVGGGALFFELYSLGVLRDKKAYLFDINAELINAYNIVKNNPCDLVKNLKEFAEKHSKEFYFEIRSWDRDESFSQRSPAERASRFIYLNKTCFNGLFRVNSKGYHNVPMGSYKNPNICDAAAILGASDALQGANILNVSYKDVLKYASSGDFVYFDPPYYPLTQTSNFTAYNENSFLDKEQIELFEVFKELDRNGVFVAHSNSDTDFIKKLYEQFHIEEILANRFINSKSSGRGKISEVLIKNFGIKKY